MSRAYLIIILIIAMAIAFTLGISLRGCQLFRENFPEPLRTETCPGSRRLNEGLATTLRGLQLDDAAARALGIPAGYYRIHEFREWDPGPNRLYGKAVEITRQYAECFGGQSSLPDVCDEWVFTRPSLLNEYTSGHVQQTHYDYHGHVLSYEYTFDSARRCADVTSATLDGQPATLILEDLSSRLLNCGLTSEPAFTRPAHACQ